MPDHYYTASPESAHEARSFRMVFAGRTLAFDTDAGVFSKQHVDPGSELLCRALPEEIAGRVLDMGCGWGAMTIMTLARFPKCIVTMADVNERALALAASNVKKNFMQATAILSDGFENLCLMNVTRLPRVHVSGCSSLDHYARGLVLKTRYALVENCYFRNVREAAITAYAEPYWGEGASPSSITVKNCRFENCGFARGPVSAFLSCVPVHRNAYNAVFSITAENNYVVTDCPHAMRFVNVSGVSVKNNICKCTDRDVVFEKCENIVFES